MLLEATIQETVFIHIILKHSHKKLLGLFQCICRNSIIAFVSIKVMTPV